MMPAGRYYVGDLCYVMTEKEWDQFCAITIKGHSVLDGEFQLPDGRKFATYCTKHGDGAYRDQYGYEYGVDAGLIGCILVDDIGPEKNVNIEALGNVHEFATDFVTGGGRGTDGWEGTIQFGRIAIETGSTWDDDDEDEYGCDDE